MIVSGYTNWLTLQENNLASNSKMKIDTRDPLVAARSTINPYRTAASLIVDRLKWDLQPKSWVHRSKIKNMRNTRTGTKGLILCNGPSLNRVDFNELNRRSEGLTVFGLNKINLLFDKTDFRPDILVCVNPFVIEQNAKFFQETGIPLFLNSLGRHHVNDRKNVFYIPLAKVRKFAKDISMSVNAGYTVTFVAMQIAFHLGIRDLALVGCDHSFATKGFANKVVVSGEKDESHFDPNYFSRGAKWQLPDLAASEDFYSMAGEVFAGHGGRVVNCTEGGNLEIFERMELPRWLKSEI